ncbi:hypothetical protein SDC9_133127 [bioreactor metagenome]|uniref:HTH OST-type domain-containing protein n=1 Tax=bioreactor metagenome TaxID=1076179 RepID=A0A645D9N1_9ZZZZ
MLLGTKTEAEAVNGRQQKERKAQEQKADREKEAQKQPQPPQPVQKAKPAKEPAKEPAKPEPPVETVEEEELETGIVPLSQIISTIAGIIDHDCDEDGWMLLSQVGIMLGRMYADFDSRNYGYSRLHKLIDGTGRFETRYELLDSGGRNLMIKNK